jgi:hypothetical protein
VEYKVIMKCKVIVEVQDYCGGARALWSVRSSSRVRSLLKCKAIVEFKVIVKCEVIVEYKVIVECKVSV